MKWLAGLLLLVMMSGPVQAQDGPRPQKVDDLVRLLQDPEVRSWLQQAPQASSQTATAGGGLAEWETATRDRLDRMLHAIPRIPAEIRAVAQEARAQALAYGGLPVFVIFLGLVAVGLVAEKLFSKARPDSRISDRLLAIGIFTAAMALVFFAFDWPPLPRIILLVSLIGVIAYRLICVLLDASTTMMPSSKRRSKMFLGVAIAGITFASLGRPLSVDPATSAAVWFCTSAILLLMILTFTMLSRGVTVRRRVALCLAYIAVWALWCVGLHGLFWLAVYAMALPSSLRLVGQTVAGLIPENTDETRRVLFIRGSRGAVIICAVAWLAMVWRFDPNSLVRSDPRVAAFSYGLLKSVVVLLLADLVWHMAKSWIDRRLLVSSPVGDANDLARQGRLRTLLPIFRNVLAVMVAVVTGLIVLAELGVEIGPLIAGAGVFGVALGFGSQTLVKDVISGVFYMLDDAFRVGEYIQAKSYKGTVEGFSLRSVRLRHHRGPVYTVPFGELGAVENMSRDWGVVKFRVSVSYDADVEKARKLTKKIGATLAEDPEFSALFIEPLKMKGVEEFGDYGMVLSFGMTLRPSGLQSMIRRRANLMIRAAFQENGIEFAQPTVQVGGDEKQAAALSAARLLEAKAASAAPT
ncbi:mechanosensitive ion channel family protein [Agrobacterium bohemicum]|uniref:Mechanosensitive ion channel protein n=1 Tax=Agrobacterium bohemicum TaxID=2052828 RepID=A0A135P801_9HYPH|nr:mechanosensitive ion channel family protein [Agrobacterium bohemicum]KXG87552.1 mechanosensitive ion channel protein [Agrobacterium bohemicum]